MYRDDRDGRRGLGEETRDRLAFALLWLRFGFGLRSCCAFGPGGLRRYLPRYLPRLFPELGQSGVTFGLVLRAFALATDDHPTGSRAVFRRRPLVAVELAALGVVARPS